MAEFARASRLLAVAATALLAGCLSSPPRLVDFSAIGRPAAVAARATTSADAASFAADRRAPRQVRGDRILTVSADAADRNAATSLAEPSSAPVDLRDLLRLAAENSPNLKQAAADVAAAHGAALQAGLHPNPTVGYQGDQIGSGHTAGQQGAFLNQTIVTRGKLGLAQAAALAEVARTEAVLEQARADLAAQVRSRYYALMTSTESLRITGDLSRTAAALAERLQKLLESGQAVAPHEVAQARALAAVAAGEVIQAENRRAAAARQLSIAAGTPEGTVPPLPPADEPIPDVAFDRFRERVLADHPDIKAAAAQVERARYQLELARVTPFPNVETNTYVQHDYQTQTPQFGLQVGVALPVFDRNQGNIAQAEAHFVRATHEAARVRIDLTQRLADTFERFSTNRRLLEQYRRSVLPEQLKAFDGLRKRFEQEPGKVSFSEVVVAQQTLARTYTDYLSILTAAWQAVAELSRLSPDGAAPSK